MKDSDTSDLIRYAKKQAPKGTKYLYVERDTISSTAFAELPPMAKLTYFYLRNLVYGHIDGAIMFPIEVGMNTLAKRIGCSEGTVKTMLMALERYGFLDLIERGSFRKGSHRYRISKRFQAWDTPQFKPGTWSKQRGWNADRLKKAREAKAKNKSGNKI